MTAAQRASFSLLALALAVAALAGCGERPPVDSVQRGYRGTGMVELSNPRIEAGRIEKIPDPVPAVPAGGPTAASIYQNVKVLGNLSVGEFTRLMVAMTQWVSPDQGCNYCHVPGNFASDDIYTKVVSRRMIEMTRAINGQHARHVGETGVVCYTCHRGNPVPESAWVQAPGLAGARGVLGNRAGQNAPAPEVGLASLPWDPFTPYLAEMQTIAVVPDTALPTGNAPRTSIKQTEWTYSLMMHLSQSLGVNCTYCHNTRSFADWETSSTQRVVAFHGIQMARDLNQQYLVPLTSLLPAHRLGPLGDVPKVNCGTCHRGVYKPLHGVSMLKDYPALAAQAAPAAAASPPSMGAAPAPAKEAK